MKTQEAIKNLTLKFTSGNSVPVTRASITNEEWEAIKSVLDLSVPQEEDNQK